MRDYILAATSVVAAILTALFGLVANRQKFREDLQAKYDQNLHNERTKVYWTLWRDLEALAKFGPEEPITTKRLDTLSRTLRNWFFHTGGLVLSDASRDAYLKLQNKIKEEIADHDLTDDLLDSKTVKLIHDLASDLRANLSKDIGSRKSVGFFASLAALYRKFSKTNAG